MSQFSCTFAHICVVINLLFRSRQIIMLLLIFFPISHSFHFISFHQARKLYRAMVLEKKRKEAVIVIAAYCRGWQVIEM